MVGPTRPGGHPGRRRPYQTVARAVVPAVPTDARTMFSVQPRGRYSKMARLEKKGDSDGAWKAFAHGLLGRRSGALRERRL